MNAAGAKEDTFDVWMKQESDTVQALGMAYAEREALEASYRAIQQVDTTDIACRQCLQNHQESCLTESQSFFQKMTRENLSHFIAFRFSILSQLYLSCCLFERRIVSI